MEGGPSSLKQFLMVKFRSPFAAVVLEVMLACNKAHVVMIAVTHGQPGCLLHEVFSIFHVTWVRLPVDVLAVTVFLARPPSLSYRADVINRVPCETIDGTCPERGTIHDDIL